ncbi:hypothetical protein H0H81_004781 [Sphagnurus paluster]|uniref:AMP-dependent synthetase/ligase domain-containing protein n=1 Tax=Sphagnurus paluster TaxID=117069 RepID=A0A9P7GKW6_9AGAR|nr:hypothetical protein H0H81_004781 [Sphagnurus paluster]
MPSLSSPSSSSLHARSSSFSRASPLAHLSQTDRALFYAHGIGPARPVPIPIVHHAFEAHAAAQPAAIAIEHHTRAHHESITYAGLDAAADRLAHALRTAHAIVPGTRVAVLARRSVAHAVAVVAALKAGAQYVPLDAQTITDETLQFVLEDATPRVVLAMHEFVHRVPTNPEAYAVLDVEAQMEIGEREMPHPCKVPDLSSPADGAYCIYTSGTTGRPKGVDVRHRGITNVLSAPPGNVHMAPGVRVAQLLNIAFDMGAWELLGALTNGATLCLRGNSRAEWVALMKTVQVVVATPSVLAQHDPREYPSLRRVIVGGEPCPQALADRWASALPDLAFHNCCGPTEISICNTITPPHVPGSPAPLPIGAPIPNTNVYILARDGGLRPVPVGAVGCMWVGGVGVSGGYLNLGERTRERWRRDLFVGGGVVGKSDKEADEEDEWAKTPRGDWVHPMMFNTGDLGRWRRDGQLEHMGRADDQVKVKGFRVELDGVACAMRAHPPVQNAVALLINNALWGFVTPASADLAAVRAAAARTQPAYAVPALERMRAMDVFPMTRNGKVDKRELSAVALGGGAGVGVETQALVQAGVQEPQQLQVVEREVEVLPSASTGVSVPPLGMGPAQFVLEETLKMVRVDLA